jgi:hypothetical protein
MGLFDRLFGVARGAEDPAARDQATARQRAAALDDERRTIVVPLDGWTEAGCVAAIEALAARVDAGDLHDRAGPGESIRIVFASGDARVGESRFFAEVDERFPGAVPAIRHLVERYAAVSEARIPDDVYRGVHVNPDDHVELLARAVRTLGVRDPSALPTLERYGTLIDAEHQGEAFTRGTVPAVIAAYGWTDDVVDFVFWFLVRDFDADVAEVWDTWGLRDAVVRREPRALARHLAPRLAEIAASGGDPGRFGLLAMDDLAAQLAQPHELWMEAFFQELDRIFAEPADAEA